MKIPFFHTEHFTSEELTYSARARQENFKNEPYTREDAEEVSKNLRSLCIKVLEPLRIMWGAPIIVTSGYRNPRLNKLVGGAETSQHLIGQAADITSRDRLQNNRLFTRLLWSGMSFDQLIAEDVDEFNCPTWIHVSYRRDGKNRNQVIINRKSLNSKS